jgi:hypothetical protein
MRNLLLIVGACLALSSNVRAQDNLPKIPLWALRSDYQEASVVARVQVQNTIPGRGDGYYYGFSADCEVVESFKGKIKRGQPIKFYARAEEGYEHQRMRGDRIAFLKRFFDEKTRKYFYQVFEDGNSVYPYSKRMAANLRALKFRWEHSRKRLRRAGRAAGGGRRARQAGQTQVV